MAKIALELERELARRALNGAPGGTTTRWLARGEGWMVGDVLCTSDPGDRPFEERHANVTIAIVTAGSFQYRSAAGRELMTPGSLLLGNAGQSFECGHEHGAGDRCLSFHYDPDYFAGLAGDAAPGRPARPSRGVRPDFHILRLPPLRALSGVVARACAAFAGSAGLSWEELSVQVAARAVQVAGGLTPGPGAGTSAATARVTRAVRRIERHADDGLTLAHLAREAGLSTYHFLRIFERLTGATPHQYVMRARLREAAVRLTGAAGRVLDVAFDSGFGDVSNFNRAFRAEFGVSPRAYRTQAGGGARSRAARG